MRGFPLKGIADAQRDRHVLAFDHELRRRLLAPCLVLVQFEIKEDGVGVASTSIFRLHTPTPR